MNEVVIVFNVLEKVGQELQKFFISKLRIDYLPDEKFELYYSNFFWKKVILTVYLNKISYNQTVHVVQLASNDIVPELNIERICSMFKSHNSDLEKHGKVFNLLNLELQYIKI